MYQFTCSHLMAVNWIEVFLIIPYSRILAHVRVKHLNLLATEIGFGYPLWLCTSICDCEPV